MGAGNAPLIFRSTTEGERLAQAERESKQAYRTAHHDEIDRHGPVHEMMHVVAPGPMAPRVPADEGDDEEREQERGDPGRGAKRLPAINPAPTSGPIANQEGVSKEERPEAGRRQGIPEQARKPETLAFDRRDFVSHPDEMRDQHLRFAGQGIEQDMAAGADPDRNDDGRPGMFAPPGRVAGAPADAALAAGRPGVRGWRGTASSPTDRPGDRTRRCLGAYARAGTARRETHSSHPASNSPASWPRDSATGSFARATRPPDGLTGRAWQGPCRRAGPPPASASPRRPIGPGGCARSYRHFRDQWIRLGRFHRPL